MSKDPAFLFYPDDYLGGTMGMTYEMKGAYIDLLIFQFHNYHFTEAQVKQVLSICFANVWEVVKNKFKTEGENNEFFYNERLRFEVNKRQAFSESRRNNALHKKSTSKAYAKHMGNGNRNRNINKKDINYSIEFTTFYNSYPKHIGKEPAWKAWQKLNGDCPPLDDLLKIVERFKVSPEWQKDNGQFIPHPATWLNQKRWQDEIVSIDRKEAWEL